MAVLESLEHLSLLESSEVPPLRLGGFSTEIPERIFAAKIDGVHTDFVICDFRDRTFVVITQLGKVATLVSVSKDTVTFDEKPDDLYTVKTVFGNDREENNHLIARFIYEHTSLTKPALFALGLKDTSPRSARAIRDILNRFKTW